MSVPANMDSELPLELEREIFETAAVIHPNMIPTLLRSEWARVTLVHPALSSLTHLALYEEKSGDQYGWDTWNQLASLPALTHLAISEGLARAIFPQVLGECRRLLVAIIPFYYFEDDPRDASSFAETLYDPRVVVMMVLDYKEDWKTGARGGDDYWARADAFVARKRKGEIKSDSYFANETKVRSSPGSM
ncbi:hypothetical protein B0H19DRAFT_1245335 [Mycena capillaripes]|nr:hypothetical protein B0H19DRAFT_1245335 [Mycena capillaripes]